MNDSRETAKPRACVIGHPVDQSRSPLVHGYWLKKYGIDGDYVRQDVAPGAIGEFMDKLRSGEAGYVGCNVTMPYKAAAFELADERDELATTLGVANTLWVEDGRIHATNTDGFGFASSLDALHPGWDYAERAVVLGAGGAGGLREGHAQLSIGLSRGGRGPRPLPLVVHAQGGTVHTLARALHGRA